MTHSLKDRKLYSNTTVRNLLTSKNGWYDDYMFNELIVKERNRSNRSGSPISFLLLDLTTYQNGSWVVSTNEFLSFMDYLLQLVTENTRDYDAKCLMTPYKIAILLVDTSIDGAKIFIEKISAELFKTFSKNGSKDHIKIINSIHLSTYPIDQVEDYEQIQGTPTIIKNVIFMSRQNSNHNRSLKERRFSVKENSRFFIDWDLKPASNGILALGTADFWSMFNVERNHVLFRLTKRAIDVLSAICGVVLLSPLMLLTAIAIKLDSRGPILFKQKRLGRYGTEFIFLKFRTMHVDCDEAIHKEYVQKLIEGKNEAANFGSKDKPLYKLDHDPRITRVGQILRKTSIDELPQFFNVLNGKMSLVGPRPPISYEVESYKNWHLRRVLEVKPGITGLWQVNGRSKTTFDEMVRLDLQYVSHCNGWLDTKIFFKTVGAVFNSDGAL
jgi:lipopolysaccharide/colanic/teichoic acid biosynthesis glycosyltransferase